MVSKFVLDKESVMLKTLAIIFGLVFLAIGILGFFPDFTPNGKLLGIFSVNNEHNIVHLVSGVVALICGLNSNYASKVYFIIFGLIYGAVAVLGFMHGDEKLFGLIAINAADNWLHAGIAVVSLYIGFFFRSEQI